MSKYLHELCCSVIEDLYGKFYARIYFHLGNNGRYNASQIAQKIRLPLRQVKAGLAAMVQLRFVYHHTESVVSTYQANTNTTYNVLRFGKLINLAQRKHGKVAAAIMIEVSLLGFTTPGELEDLIVSSPKTLPSGHKDVAVSKFSKQQIFSVIQDLMKYGFLVPLRSAQFQVHFDAFHDAEARMKDLGLFNIAKGRKGQIEHEERVEDSVRSRQSTDSVEAGFVPLSTTGYKRPSEDDAKVVTKRLKLSNGTASAQINGEVHDHEQSADLKETTLICLSYQNLVMSIRDDYLGEQASKILDPKHGQILRVALSQISTRTQHSAPNNEHWLDLDKLHHLLEGNLNGASTNGLSKVNGGSSTYLDEGHGGNEPNITRGELDRCLASLSEGGFGFLQGGYSKDQWKIDYYELNLHVQKQEILRMIRDRLGSRSLRLVRMLMEKGKLDEKCLQEMGLLGAKDLRQTLAELNQMGFIDLQEVPRDAQRQTSRTIFLWFHDQERVRKVLLEELYKVMTRLLQRLRKDRQDLSSTLEKVERSDVKGSEDQMLPAAELRMWKRWQRKEEWLLGEIGRLDASVAILRDL